MTSSGSRTDATRILANASTRSFPEDMTTTGHFFDTHKCVHGNHPKKIMQGPTALRLPAPSIYLDGFISVIDLETLTGTQAPYFVHTEKENRKHKTSQRNTQELTSSKQARTELSTPVPLRSEFADVPRFSKITFTFAKVSILNDGAVNIEFPDLNDHKRLTTFTYLLQDAPFNQGKTQKVILILDGLSWVAKRFFNIGAG
ncbi:hypothetical protein B0H17DRAFT_1132243 [Mycena rosella]|uniref:Uncharacterized protein n=1 Tax=Mycena rosella TaxID=1033263 RepID=A0AAD7DNL8_MYCRO|nr:hypothetical protein B0H17DRAFT_1132243 [Mycena rosella]